MWTFFEYVYKRQFNWCSSISTWAWVRLGSDPAGRRCRCNFEHVRSCRILLLLMMKQSRGCSGWLIVAGRPMAHVRRRIRRREMILRSLRTSSVSTGASSQAGHSSRLKMLMTAVVLMQTIAAASEVAHGKITGQLERQFRFGHTAIVSINSTFNSTAIESIEAAAGATGRGPTTRPTRSAVRAGVSSTERRKRKAEKMSGATSPCPGGTGSHEVKVGFVV